MRYSNPPGKIKPRVVTGTMTIPIATITNPIALCAYVLCAVFGLLARHWNAPGTRPQDRKQSRQLFYLAAFLSIAALAGGLSLAWHQTAKPPQPTAPTAPVLQQSTGDQSPNINSSGSGTVSVQIGNAPPAKPDPAKPTPAKPKP